MMIRVKPLGWVLLLCLAFWAWMISLIVTMVMS